MNTIACRTAKMSAALLGVFLLAGCTSAEIGPGEAGVIVDHPYFFGHGGVRPDAVATGRVITWMSSDVQSVSLVPHTYQVAFTDFATKDNILMEFETSVQLRVVDPVNLVRNYGADWFKNNIASQYTAMVRELVKGQTMSDIMSNQSTAKQMDRDITKQLTDFVAKNHLPVQVMAVSLGRAQPNTKVLEQINETAAQQQRQKTLQAATLAEDQRAKSEAARALADQAYQKQMGYSSQQYVGLQIAQIQADACKAAVKCVILPPGTGVTVPLDKAEAAR